MPEGFFPWWFGLLSIGLFIVMPALVLISIVWLYGKISKRKVSLRNYILIFVGLFVVITFIFMLMGLLGIS